MACAPVVCCEAHVSAVQLTGTQYTVEFTGSVPLNLPTPIRPDGSRSYYYAEYPDKPHANGGDPKPSNVGVEKSPDEKDTKEIAPIPVALAAQTQSEAQYPEKHDGQGSEVQAETPVEAETSNTEAPHSGHFELLKRGIDAWNFARRSKPEVQPNLRGANLRSVLKEEYATRIDFSRTDLREANLAGLHLYKPSFVGASLCSANLEGSSWIGANTEGMESYVVRYAFANLSKAMLAGADLSGTQMEKACLQGADFRQSNLKSANFSYSKLRGLRFDGADLRNANFRGADLTEAILDGADFRGADLSTTTVTRAQLAKAQTDSTTKLPVDWDF